MNRQEKKKKTAFEAVDCISKQAGRAVLDNFDLVCEVRIRSDRPIVIYLLNKPYYIGTNGELISPYSCTDLRSICVINQPQLKDAFVRLCKNSVYKHTDNIGRGFITAAGGHRIGVCGEAVTENGKVRGAANITSMNVRIAKEFIGCADNLTADIDLKQGLLVCGAPGTGKTTVLRDIARSLSLFGRNKVSIVDERYEIAGQCGTSMGFDVGLCDVYSGYPKSVGMMMAIRTMSPDFIICDELTGENAEQAAAAFGCGVSVVASVHCANDAQAKRNRIVRELISTGSFGSVIYIDQIRKAGKI